MCSSATCQLDEPTCTSITDISDSDNLGNGSLAWRLTQEVLFLCKEVN